MAAYNVNLGLAFLLAISPTAKAEITACAMSQESRLDHLELRLSSRVATKGENVEVVILARDRGGRIMHDDLSVQLHTGRELVTNVEISGGFGVTNIETGILPVGTFEVFARSGPIVSRQDELDIIIMPGKTILVSEKPNQNFQSYQLNEIELSLADVFPDGASFKFYWGNIEQGISMVPIETSGNFLRTHMVAYNLPLSDISWLAFRGHNTILPPANITTNLINIERIRSTLRNEEQRSDLIIENIQYTDNRNIEDGTPITVIVSVEGRKLQFFGQVLSGRAEISNLPDLIKNADILAEIRDIVFTINLEVN